MAKQAGHEDDAMKKVLKIHSSVFDNCTATDVIYIFLDFLWNNASNNVPVQTPTSGWKF